MRAHLGHGGGQRFMVRTDVIRLAPEGTNNKEWLGPAMFDGVWWDPLGLSWTSCVWLGPVGDHRVH